MFVVASPIDAAPLASVRDTRKALHRRLLFEERFDVAQFSSLFGAHWTNPVCWELFRALPLPSLAAAVRREAGKIGDGLLSELLPKERDQN
jgi:hypothetical protein